MRCRIAGRKAIVVLTLLCSQLLAFLPAQAHTKTWNVTLHGLRVVTSLRQNPDYFIYQANGCQDLTEGVAVAVINMRPYRGHMIKVAPVSSTPASQSFLTATQLLSGGACQTSEDLNALDQTMGYPRPGQSIQFKVPSSATALILGIPIDVTLHAEHKITVSSFHP